MDCGPAALAALAGGLRVPVSYSGLRERCQTGVDGTSIDTIEDVAVGLGLDAEQVLVAADDVVDREVGLLPAIVITRMPNGFTHFVVAWRTVGPFVMVMDPAVGRRWVRRSRFIADCYVHRMPVSAEAWWAAASSTTACDMLTRRLTKLGVDDAVTRVGSAVSSGNWPRLAHLQAAARWLTALQLRHGVHRDGIAQAALTDETVVPRPWWPATAAAGDSGDVEFAGAVLVRASRRVETVVPVLPAGPAGRGVIGALLRRASHDGVRRAWVLASLVVVSALGLTVEALLLRGVFDGLSAPAGQIAGSSRGWLLAVAAVLLMVEWLMAGSALRLGRVVEHGFRRAFARLLPGLSDGYVRSRPNSDLVERVHNIHRLRAAPEVGVQIGRAASELLLTVAALIWLHRASWPAALVGMTVVFSVTVVFQGRLAEHDLRLRTHQGALAQLAFDGLLGVTAVRAHRGSRAMDRVYDDLAGEWRRSAWAGHRAAVIAEGVQAMVAVGVVGWLLAGFADDASTMRPGSVLLFVYWVLAIPVIATDLAVSARQWPRLRSVLSRLLEPFDDNASPDTPVAAASHAGRSNGGGVDIGFKDVCVVASGHEVLSDVDLTIAAGEHVAIVGPSGAGKSTLLGLVLGWHQPAHGTVLVGGRVLDADGLRWLRDNTAWVDPAVQLWNAPLLDNLHYGFADTPGAPAAELIAAAGLAHVVSRLGGASAVALGESGGLVSGGEGQRVRLGRGIHRGDARLVVLDEAFRGLERAARSDLLDEARRHWASATLVCATHDLADTLGFDRVVVVVDGRVIEDGVPGVLAAAPSSRYRAMLDAETAARALLFDAPGWRRVVVADGALTERTATAV